MKILVVAASTLAILLTIGLATHVRVGAPVYPEFCNPTTDRMTVLSMTDAQLSGANPRVMCAPQRKRSEPGSIVALVSAQLDVIAPIWCALAIEPLRSEAARVRISRLRV